MADENDFIITDGVLVKYKGKGGDVVIPDGVTEIGKEAFANNYLVNSVKIPEGVTKIGENAFYRSGGLKNVTIPESVTEIGKYAFMKCAIENLDHKLLKIKNGVALSGDGKTVLYAAPFETERAVIPEGVTQIDDSAFQNCSKLTDISIPNSVTKIGSYAFSFCKGLKDITIPDTVTQIGDGAFDFCSGLSNITIPKGVIQIEEGTFSSCNGLTNVKIPEGVTKIGENAFADCKNLATITIPETVTEIGKGAFRACKIDNLNHKLLKIKDGVALSEDGKTALYCASCSNPVMTIPEGVTIIAKGAFLSFLDLKEIRIPDTVVEIEEEAFYYKNMTAIEYLGSAKEWGKINFADKKEKTVAKGLVKDFVVQQEKNEKILQLNEATAEGFMSAMSKAYPDFKYFIIKTAKANFTAFIMKGKNGAVVQLSSNFETLSKKFPKFVEAFGDESKSNDEIYALFAEHKIKMGEIKAKDPLIKIECNELVFFTEDFKCASPFKSIFAESKIKNFSFGHCTSIEDAAFYECKDLENVTFPEWIPAIGTNAFCHCTNLASVTIPEGVTKIGNNAFNECALKSVSIPESVTAIENDAFISCKNLEHVTIPESVAQIGQNAFKNCKIENLNHKLLKIKDGVALSEDGKTALYHADTSNPIVVIPEGVTTINYNAFSYSNITDVTIPESVTEIKSNVFLRCAALKNVTFQGSKEQWEKTTIEPGNDELKNAAFTFKK